MDKVGQYLGILFLPLIAGGVLAYCAYHKCLTRKRTKKTHS